MTEAQMLSMCDTMITPPCIAGKSPNRQQRWTRLTYIAMYNITQATKSAKGNELGIFEEGDFYSATDLIEFFATFAKSLIPSKI
jgi:tripeptidyl-peptidase-1